MRWNGHFPSRLLKARVDFIVFSDGCRGGFFANAVWWWLNLGLGMNLCCYGTDSGVDVSVSVPYGG